MQLMFRAARSDYLLSSTLSAPSGTKATAGMQGNNIVIKVAHYSALPVSLDISLAGFSFVGSAASAVLLTSAAGPEAMNSLEQPHNVEASTSSIPASATFSVKVPAWSVLTVTLPGAAL